MKLIAIMFAAVFMFAMVPAVTSADCSLPCPTLCESPCLAPAPTTLCTKVTNTVEQPIGFVEDIIALKPIAAAKRVVATGLNLATLPIDIALSTPCVGGCGEPLDFAAKVEPLPCLALNPCKVFSCQ